MTSKRSLAVLCIVALIGLLLTAGYAWAEATETPVAGERSVIPRAELPKRDWVDDELVWHVRGARADLVLSGDMVGTGLAIVNFNLDLMTGDGDESGWVTLELTWGDLSGTFEGRFSTTYTNGAGTGHGVYHGTGDFAGMKFMEDFSVVLDEPPYVATYEGIILDPHGE